MSRLESSLSVSAIVRLSRILGYKGVYGDRKYVYLRNSSFLRPFQTLRWFPKAAKLFMSCGDFS